MQTQEQTSKQYFKALNIIFAALLIGQLLFGSMIFAINMLTPIFEGVKDLDILNLSFLIIIPLFMIGGIILGRFIGKEKLKIAKEKESLGMKLEDYRALTIIRLALLQGPAFLAIISYMLTGNWVFLGLAGLLALVFLTNAPSKNKLVHELELSHSDRKLIEEPLAVVAYINRSNN